jgi:MFS transporter, DHA3 family, macrolide efflux protein
MYGTSVLPNPPVGSVSWLVDWFLEPGAALAAAFIQHYGGIIGIAVGVLLQAAAPSNWFFLGIFGFALAGFMVAIANGPLFAILQSKVAPEMQGRVFSLISSVASIMVPLSMVVAGPLAESIGVRAWYWIGGVGCLVLGLGAFFNRAIANIEEDEDPIAKLAVASG